MEPSPCQAHPPGNLPRLRCTGPQGFAGTNPPQALADRIHGIWVNFARSGELPWPQYDAKGRQVFSLEAGVATSEPVMPAERILS